jgi:hypothetical protein
VSRSEELQAADEALEANHANFGAMPLFHSGDHGGKAGGKEKSVSRLLLGLVQDCLLGQWNCGALREKAFASFCGERVKKKIGIWAGHSEVLWKPQFAKDRSR